MLMDLSKIKLNRSDAPFGHELWEQIDTAVTHTAKNYLGGRKLLYTEGPFGYNLKSVPCPDNTVEEKNNLGGTTISVCTQTPLSLISYPFTIAGRDIELFLQSGFLSLIEPVITATIACAQKEDALILYGSESVGIHGLCTTPGVQHHTLRAWNQVGDSVDDIIAAVTKLDNEGFHGPYTLGLEPALYNQLFKRYPQGNTLEIEHLKSLITDGIVKIPSLHSGGIILASDKQYASIVLGRDLTADFEGPEEVNYRFFISESLALKLNAPSAVCILDKKQ